MGFLDSVKAWFSREAAEARDVGEKTMGRLEADLARREAELAATPEDRMAQLQDRIAGNDAAFDELQSKIEGRGALADATEDVAALDRPETDDDPPPA